jgi:hypothetical protein
MVTTGDIILGPLLCLCHPRCHCTPEQPEQRDLAGDLQEGFKALKELRETAQVKPSNPKEAVGCKKLPMHLVSGIVKAYQAIAHYLGNVKYGAWNYAAEGARASTYMAAMNRHMDRWWLGEENDSVDGTPHLANALACINILIECQQRGNLNDDRPPSFDLGPLYEKLEKTQAEIQERYKDRNPRHYTIKDTSNG